MSRIGVSTLEGGHDVVVLHALLRQALQVEKVAAKFSTTVVVHGLHHGGLIYDEESQESSLDKENKMLVVKRAVPFWTYRSKDSVAGTWTANDLYCFDRERKICT